LTGNLVFGTFILILKCDIHYIIIYKERPKSVLVERIAEKKKSGAIRKDDGHFL